MVAAKRRSKRGQAAVEFIIILAVVLSIAATLGAMNISTLGEQQSTERVIKSQDAVNEVYKAAELVYYEGEGAKTKIFITIPEGVSSVMLDDGLIEMNLSMNGGLRSIKRKHDFDISGDFPIDKGYYWVSVESKGNYVELSH